MVLQAQSQEPSFSPGQVTNDTYPYAEILVDSIEQIFSCTEPLFFMTWGRKYGDQQNCQFYPPICTYAGMQQRLRESYVKWQITLSNETFALKILKMIEVNIIETKAKIVDLGLCEQICTFIIQSLSENLKYIEKKHKVKINLKPDNKFIIPDYKIEFKNKSKKIINTLEKISKLEIVKESIEENSLIKNSKSKSGNKFKRKNFYKKKFYKKKN